MYFLANPICFSLENIPCALEKNVYSVAFGWNVLYISVKSIWSNVSFKADGSLLIFCQDDLSIDISGVLQLPTIIVLLFLPSSLLTFALYI